jgi:heat shock protein HslJ
MKRAILIPFLAVALALSMAACSSSGGSDLTGKAWQWSSGTEPGTPMPGVVPNPQQYTATFNSDSSIAVKADCNNATGTYKAASPNLTITLGPTTLAMCSADSLSSVFLAGLQKSSTYAISNGALTITLSDGGTMSFK